MSKPQKNVFDVINQPQHLHLSSDFGNLKYYRNGIKTLTVSKGAGTQYRERTFINHDLGYFPFFIVYIRDDSMSTWVPMSKIAAGSGITRIFESYATKSRLFFIARGFSGDTGDSYTVQYQYKIYKNVVPYANL